MEQTLPEFWICEGITYKNNFGILSYLPVLGLEVDRFSH